jgi:hypothetical protein
MMLWERQPNRKENLWLLTPEEFLEVPNGTVLISIYGEHKVKGVDKLSDDTRFGILAYGLTKTMAESQGLTDKFIIWMLKS